MVVYHDFAKNTLGPIPPAKITKSPPKTSIVRHFFPKLIFLFAHLLAISFYFLAHRWDIVRVDFFINPNPKNMKTFSYSSSLSPSQAASSSELLGIICTIEDEF